MSSREENFFSLASLRLVEERKALALSQAGAGEACGVSREMWGKYERGQAVPGGEVLFAFAARGADVQYILTGTRSASLGNHGHMAEPPAPSAARVAESPPPPMYGPLSVEETMLVTYYRAIRAPGRAALIHVAQALSEQ